MYLCKWPLQLRSSSTGGGKMTKNQTVGVDSGDDSDDYGIAQVNCELAMVEGQLCNIPYELYDLPDLTGILSVETWDISLTEEERFFLSGFLPDMDQETFTLTMQELIGGANLYFGNPVDKFYKSLRGGLLTPKVACCRDGVTLLKRKKYYYSLEFYHEKIIKTFTKMQRLWDHCGKKLGNKSRLLYWSEERTQNENLKLLDLNRVPSEEMGEEGATHRLTNPSDVKSVERSRSESLTFPRGGVSKNILKVKTDRVFKDQGSSIVSYSEHLGQTLPRGLLKVAPKYSSAILGEPYLARENSLLQIQKTGSTSGGSRFAASPYLGTSFRKPRGTIACSITELPRCLRNHQNTSFTKLETAQRSIEEQELVSHDTTRTNPRGVGALNSPITERNQPRKQEEYVHYDLKSPGFKPEIVVRGSETKETRRILSGKNFGREEKVRKPLGVLREDDHHAGDGGYNHLYSLTYKRRKYEGTGVT